MQIYITSFLQHLVHITKWLSHTKRAKNNNMKSLLFIIVLLLSSLSVFGQLGRNALPGGLESYTVYETNSPSFQKILELVSVQEPEIIKWWIYKDGFSVDKVIKRWNFERKMFKDYAIEIMRVDSVLLLQISEYSGYGELDRSRYDMEPLIVLEQNGAHFFFTPTGFNSNDEQKMRVCINEFIKEFLIPTQRTYGRFKIADRCNYWLFHFEVRHPVIFKFIKPAWICELNDNNEWQITYRTVTWDEVGGDDGPVRFINIAPSKVRIRAIYKDNEHLYLKKYRHLRGF